MSLSKFLLDDVVIEILSRLPVKTLIRFRCVSKSWHSTITYPSFITIHLNRASFRHNAYSEHDRYLKSTSGPSGKKLRWFFLSDQSYDNHVHSEMLLNCRPRCFLILVGSMNSIVCLSYINSDIGASISVVYLWNPSIRNFETLPCSSIAPQPSDGGYKSVIFGFGFHCQTNDYKVIRILYSRQGHRQVEVYTLSTNSWRKIETHVTGSMVCIMGLSIGFHVKGWNMGIVL